jgi:hypothetical protein
MAKGGNFEGEISKRLSLWFTNDMEETAFWRTSSSGARATSRKKVNKDVQVDDFGDLKAESPMGKPLTDFFTIELKTGYAKKAKSKAKKHDGKEVIKITNWDILDAVDSNQGKPQIYQFWEQVERDAEIANKEPLLIFRRNNKQPCIAMYTDIFKSFVSKCDYPDFEFITLNFCSEDMCFPSITVCNLYKFFEWTKGKIKVIKLPIGEKYSCPFITFNLKRTVYKRGRGIK